MGNQKKTLKSWFEHPLTRGLDLDDPRTTYLRKRIIREKPHLHEIYDEWYQAISNSLPVGHDHVLEIGSGASFFNEYVSHLVSSDVFLVRGIDTVLDGQYLPFKNASMKSIVMTDVFHHLPDPRQFLHEAARCIRKNGSLIMIEPWVTPWSTYIYQKFHHEPFNPTAENWEFPTTGPLSGANGALPWIVFNRDRKIFLDEFPEWQIETINLWMPFIYLSSGGISTREIIPGYFYRPLRYIEKILSPFNDRIAMFAFILLRRF